MGSELCIRDRVRFVSPEGFWAVPVEVGLSDNSKVEITRGLAEGQEVFIGYQNPDEMYY